jgi:hypothetical protein
MNPFLLTPSSILAYALSKLSLPHSATCRGAPDAPAQPRAQHGCYSGHRSHEQTGETCFLKLLVSMCVMYYLLFFTLLTIFVPQSVPGLNVPPATHKAYELLKDEMVNEYGVRATLYRHKK